MLLDTKMKLGDAIIAATAVAYGIPLVTRNVADFKHIDPGFGSNADFTRLTQEGAKRGIRVVVDTSLNHTGSDSPYFDRYGNFKSGGAFEGSRIRREHPITLGRIEGHGKRGKALSADYVLEYRNTKLAVVEAKALSSSSGRPLPFRSKASLGKAMKSLPAVAVPLSVAYLTVTVSLAL